jgi:hypothetical protein
MRYKGKKPHFEISVKLWILHSHADPFEQKNVGPNLVTFSLFWHQKFLSA